MKKDSQLLLRDPNIKPTDKVIADCLGTTNDIFIRFITELEKQDISLMDWRYYNDGKAWLSKGEYKWNTSRGTHKIKPIFWMSIWENFFKVSFNFSEKSKDELLSLLTSENTKELIKDIKPNGNQMKFIPVIFDVDSHEQFNDIFLLAQFRKENR